MQVFDALKAMRQLSEQRIPFSFEFMSYSRSRQQSSGIVTVNRARLKPRSREATYEGAEVIEEYIDLDTGEPHRFYQCNLMFFNHQKLTL